MKFLSDENVPRSIVIFIRKKGYDVKDIQEEKLRGLEDEKVIELAQKEHRIIITYDKDFIASPDNLHTTGIILLRFPRIHPKDVIPYLQVFFANKTFAELDTSFILILTQDKIEIIRQNGKER